MKTIITGSYTINDYLMFKMLINDLSWDVTYIITGGYGGVDTLAFQYAQEFDLPIKIITTSSYIETGESLEIRNKEMVKEAEACLVIWNESKGASKELVDLAIDKNLKISIRNFNYDNIIQK